MILLPSKGDNAAIATRRIEAGEIVDGIAVRGTVLEGHRVAAKAIAAEELILSWGLPFGRALRAIAPGEYLCNARIVEVLRQRHVDFEIPNEPNFENYRLRFELEEEKFVPGAQTSIYPQLKYFEGYLRAGNRGAGTRNFVVVLATSSRANSVARGVAAAFKGENVVAVTHTEGGGPARPNNFDLVARTLNGFLQNPNVAAFVAIDEGNEPVNNRVIKVNDPPGAFVSINGNFEEAIKRGKAEVARMLPIAAACARTRVSAAHLKIGLQCGGSDAFSGVSGNPLVGWMAREIVRCGGAGNLAETSELMGAESYVLANVRDVATARKFLATVARFEKWAAWHGHSAEGNPSGGNLFRGLYNITIKSIGAALKKSADTRLDYVIDYGEPMDAPGFYFMDSPGNDLESIAGQVASGCNMILFTTGNGSITNFPFVPTIKVMTTTRRFEMLKREMDFNAGRYLDGEPMDRLGAEAFELMLHIASGESSAGEKAGHAQTQLWRDWQQTGPGADLSKPSLSGKPLEIGPVDESITVPRREVDLIVPTSLCAGQIAMMIAEAGNRKGEDLRCVALPHTEGCGNSGGESERLMLRTLAGYAVHPLARRTLMLEHGCEKTHNDAFRNTLSAEEAARLGWLSVQMDGGIEPVIRKAVKWFAETPKRPADDKKPLRVGLVGDFSEAASFLAKKGALVVVPESSMKAPATIDYGQPAPSRGLHIMRTPTENLTEILTGLGATGVEVIVVWNEGGPVQHHPFIPVLEVRERKDPQELLELILRAASENSALPTHADFQITRGLEGVSL